jgi:ornithine--oxo-acid transaminase
MSFLTRLSLPIARSTPSVLLRCASTSAAPALSKTEQLIKLEHKYGAHNYEPIPVVLSKGKGVHVWDVEGNRYLDFLGAYAAVSQGHCHPKIIGALIRQCQQMTLTSRAFHNDALGEFDKFVTEYFGFERVLPMNTGVEAWETACKLARRWAYEVKGVPEHQARLVFADNNFHGRSIAACSASTDPDCYGNYGPLLPNFDKIPFNNLAALEKAVSNPNTAAFVCEPIQGEAGVIVPDAGYIAKATEICHKHNVLFVADEVQTGVGRTGKLIACDYDNVKPDILVLAKALSGGTIPVSCVLASDEIMLTIRPGQHGSTFGGSPLAARVAITALQVLRDEHMVENSFNMGEILRAKLKTIKSPLIKEVRGRGLMNAIVINPTPTGQTAWDVCMRLKDNGLLAKPSHGHIVRLSPPLVLTEDQVLESADIIERTITSFH